MAPNSKHSSSAAISSIIDHDLEDRWLSRSYRDADNDANSNRDYEDDVHITQAITMGGGRLPINNKNKQQQHPFVDDLCDVEILEQQQQQGNEIYGRDPKRTRRRCRTCCCSPTLCCMGIAWIAVLALAGFLVRQHYSNNNMNTADDMEPPGNNDPNADFIVRINCGANQPYTDSEQNIWLPDSQEYGAMQDKFQVTGEGATYADRADSSREQERGEKPILNAGFEGSALYDNERYFTGNDGGVYQVFVPQDGLYEVTLFFAELVYSAPNQRVFAVVLEDQVVEDNFDIFVQANNQSFTAVQASYATFVNDGAMSIAFQSKVEHAKISGIEVKAFHE